MRGPVSHSTPTTPTADRLRELLAEPVVADQRELADRLGVSDRAVRRGLACLEAAGALLRERRHDAAGHRLADRLVPTGRGQSLASISRKKAPEAARRPEGTSTYPVEVEKLRAALTAAGIDCSWKTLRADVVAEIVGWVRTIGVPALVAEAKRRVWSPVIRHVAAFLRFWRALPVPRPRRVVCPFHPAESTDRGRRCPGCESERTNRVPMPDFLRAGRWRTSAIQST